MNLTERIDAFVAHCQQVLEKYYKETNWTLPIERYTVEYLSEKWARIHRGNHSVYAFVALQDFSTKVLGQIQAGQIFKPASYKAPAKHARGSVFSEDFDNCAGPHSIIYLR